MDQNGGGIMVQWAWNKASNFDISKVWWFSFLRSTYVQLKSLHTMWMQRFFVSGGELSTRRISGGIQLDEGATWKTPISNSSELEGWRPDQALASPHGLHTKWIQYWHHIPVQVLDFYISLSPPSSNIILTLTCSGSRFRQESMHLTQMCHKLTYELWGDVFVISWKCTLIQANSEAREARTLISQRIHLFMPSLP